MSYILKTYAKYMQNIREKYAEPSLNICIKYSKNRHNIRKKIIANSKALVVVGTTIANAALLGFALLLN